MKVNRRIVLSILIIPSVIGILHGISMLLPIYLHSHSGLSAMEIGMLQAYIKLTEYALNPFIFFVASYFLVRNLDVKAELRTTVTSVFLSCFLGVFIGYVMGYGYMAIQTRDFSDMLFIGVLYGLIDGLYSGSILFCVSFSAIAIAYLRKSRAKPQIF